MTLYHPKEINILNNRESTQRKRSDLIMKWKEEYAITCISRLYCRDKNRMGISIINNVPEGNFKAK